MKRDIKFYWKLFLSTFQLSAFTFGGGYVIVPLMKKQFVEKLGWIDEHEMLDFTAIAQSTPGAMAVNASVLLGYRLAGIPGALVSILGTVLPPLILLSVISVGYGAFISNQTVKNVLRGMQAGVCAVIIDVVIDMGRKIVKDKKARSNPADVCRFHCGCGFQGKRGVRHPDMRACRLAHNDEKTGEGGGDGLS